MHQDVIQITSSIKAAALWGGLNLLVLLVLAFLVTRSRQTHKVLLGDNSVEPLTRAIRVHGNAVEYVPALLAALALLTVAGAPSWLVHLVGALTLVGRLLHAFGLSRSSGVTPGRFIGTLLTFTAFIVAGGALIWLGLR